MQITRHERQAEKMNIEELRVDDLIPYENNPRNNEEAVDKVALSISSFGFKVPIIVDRNNVIVAGHTRLSAAKKLGLTTVPTIRADDLTDDQIRAFRLADNKVSEFATWDMDKLEEELHNLDIDMSMFGFDALEKELKDLNIQEDDFEPDEDEKEPPRAKVGDVYQLGDHRLMCGDSSDPEAVRTLMGGGTGGHGLHGSALWRGDREQEQGDQRGRARERRAHRGGHHRRYCLVSGVIRDA